MFAADGDPGKFDATNMAFAGSFPSTWKLIDGITLTSLAQMSYCVNEPPKLKLCEPLSQLIESSSSRLFALRDWGRHPPHGAGPVSCEPTVGKFSSKPW